MWLRDEAEAVQAELNAAIQAQQNCERQLETSHAAGHFGHLTTACEQWFHDQEPAEGIRRRPRFNNTRGHVRN
jgi:hypothetical protein